MSFDLDTNMLKDYYPSENWRKAYVNIKSFMLNEGFQWQQGSVYISSESLTEAETTAIIKKFIEQEPWLNVCMRDCVIANIGRSHSQNYLFDKNADIQPREKAAEADERPRQLYISR